jgi:glucose/arabinose dehydrogenase
MRMYLSLSAALAAAALSHPLHAQTPLTSTRVVSGLVRPVYVTHAPNDYSRIFIIEKQGRIRIAQINPVGAYTLLATPFLDIDPIVTGGTTESSEQGLLGLAFHPNYPADPRFFVNYTATSPAGATVVAAYTVSANPNVANTTGDIILTFSQPQANHNGGWTVFGPDGYLYIATGDGGNANDAGTGHTEPGGNAQDITSNLLGKILRIDVNGDDFPADANRDYRIPPSNPFVGVTGDDEIWAYGLRNPWRNDFDPLTGDLYIADVGQDTVEEINFQPASTGLPGSPGYQGGRNYGWRCYEGTNIFNFDSVCTAFPGPFIAPIYTYTHASGCSVTGGVVYRGCAIPDLQGTYFFADYCSAFIRSFRVVGGVATAVTVRTTELAPGGGLGIASITSFGRDAFGEIYICDSTGGEVFKIIPATIVGPDCNGNNRRDACDIRAGSSCDVNANGIPDECECPADFNGNGTYEPVDIAIFLNIWFASVNQGTRAGDYDCNGLVQPQDVASMVTAWFNAAGGAGC